MMLLNLDMEPYLGPQYEDQKEIFEKIYENLIWIDFYKSYKKEYGFFYQYPELGSLRKYYLPYLINYIEKRVAYVYFILCVNDDNYPKYLNVLISEGHMGKIYYTEGMMKENMFELCPLYRDYYFLEDEYKRTKKASIKSKYVKEYLLPYIEIKYNNIISYINKYFKLLNTYLTDDIEKNDLIFRIITTISYNFDQNKPKWFKDNFYVLNTFINDDSKIYDLIKIDGNKFISRFITNQEEIIEERIPDFDLPKNFSPWLN